MSEKISLDSSEIKQLITDKIPIKVALLLDILIYTFSLNYHRKIRL